MAPPTGKNANNIRNRGYDLHRRHRDVFQEVRRFQRLRIEIGVLVVGAVTVVVSLVFRGVNYNLAWGFSLATLLPNIAVGVRRLHDTNRSGWWLLLYLLPVIGWIVLIVFWVEPGQPSRYAEST